MAMTSGFFDAMLDSEGNPDRDYSSKQFGELFSLFFTNGIFADYGEEFAVTASDTGGLSVEVGTGFCFINGCWGKNPDNITFTVQPNSSTAVRNDGVFLTRSDSDRNITVKYRAGDTTPKETETIKELLIAIVHVNPNATSITQAQIEDMRPTKQCGFVAGAVQQLSVAELYAQFTEEFTAWSNAKKAEFDTWFNAIKNQLSTDAAGNLQLQVDGLKTSVNNLASYDSETGILTINTTA